MNSTKFYIILSIFILFSSFSIAQQSNCALKLDEAESLYEMGDLDSIPAMLRSCINDGFENEELSRAYKLLIRTYLFEDYQEMAELTMMKFLKKFPEYEIKANDPVEFEYLYKSYKTIPLYSIGFIGGINYSFVRLIQAVNFDGTNKSIGEYVSVMGYQGGFQFKRYINDEIEINLDALILNRKFHYDINILSYIVAYDESQTHLSFPLTGTYDFDFNLNRFRPYVRFGLNLDYMLSSSASITTEFTGPISREPSTGPDINIKEDRNELNFGILAGGGMKFNLKKSYFMLDLRYSFGLTNNVNGENRLTDAEKNSFYFYADDDFSVNNVYISVGYVLSLYKTKKQK